MRENIGLYRAKRKDNGKWAKGYYCVIEERHFILTHKCELAVSYYQGPNIPAGYPKLPGSYEVIPETVGQYIGIKDKNGVKMFEGDIFNIGKIYRGVEVSDIRQLTSILEAQSRGVWLEVIGNVHENPELMESQ